jgi:hypothetical protein
MIDPSFKLMRWALFFTAPIFVVGWLMMDSKLTIQQSSEIDAVISYVTKKQVEYVRLLTAQHGEIEVSCLQASELCQRKRPAHGEKLLVHVQNTGILSGWWLVSATHGGEPLVTLEVQSAAYRQAKFMWGLGTLAAVLAVLVFLYFAPFRPPQHEA